MDRSNKQNAGYLARLSINSHGTSATLVHVNCPQCVCVSSCVCVCVCGRVHIYSYIYTEGDGGVEDGCVWHCMLV